MTESVIIYTNAQEKTINIPNNGFLSDKPLQIQCVGLNDKNIESWGGFEIQLVDGENHGDYKKYINGLINYSLNIDDSQLPQSVGEINLTFDNNWEVKSCFNFESNLDGNSHQITFSPSTVDLKIEYKHGNAVYKNEEDLKNNQTLEWYKNSSALIGYIACDILDNADWLTKQDVNGTVLNISENTSNENRIAVIQYKLCIQDLGDIILGNCTIKQNNLADTIVKSLKISTSFDAEDKYLTPLVFNYSTFYDTDKFLCTLDSTQEKQINKNLGKSINEINFNIDSSQIKYLLPTSLGETTKTLKGNDIYYYGDFNYSLNDDEEYKYNANNKVSNYYKKSGFDEIEIGTSYKRKTNNSLTIDGVSYPTEFDYICFVACIHRCVGFETNRVEAFKGSESSVQDYLTYSVLNKAMNDLNSPQERVNLILLPNIYESLEMLFFDNFSIKNENNTWKKISNENPINTSLILTDSLKLDGIENNVKYYAEYNIKDSDVELNAENNDLTITYIPNLSNECYCADVSFKDENDNEMLMKRKLISTQNKNGYVISYIEVPLKKGNSEGVLDEWDDYKEVFLDGKKYSLKRQSCLPTSQIKICLSSLSVNTIDAEGKSISPIKEIILKINPFNRDEDEKYIYKLFNSAN